MTGPRKIFTDPAEFAELDDLIEELCHAREMRARVMWAPDYTPARYRSACAIADDALQALTEWMFNRATPAVHDAALADLEARSAEQNARAAESAYDAAEGTEARTPDASDCC